jgi:predicted DNA-binding protein (MmcQ/YjbR family)
MKLAAYNTFCKSLPHTAHVVQWGGAHVWKVGGPKGKMFAICWSKAGETKITFKCSEMSYDLLKDLDGLRPAPYLASRGMKWIQWFGDATLDDAALKDYLRESHRQAAANLPKASQTRVLNALI